MRKKEQEDLSLQRLPPQNIEAEESLITSILMNNDNLHDAVEIVSPDDFYKTSHGEIFSVTTSLYAKDEPVDLVTLTNALREQGKLDRVGGAAYLAKLMDTAPLAVNARQYAAIIRNKAFLRNLLGVANEIMNLCFMDRDVDEVMDFVERAIFDELTKGRESNYCHVRDVIERSFDQIESRQGKRFIGVPSGFTMLDNLTYGFQKANLIILAARPAMGKTALALNIARNVAVEEKIPVAVFSLEMPKEEICERLVCAEARVSSSRLKDGYLSMEDWTDLTEAADVLSDAPIFIDDSASLTVLDLRAKARRMKVKEGVGLIIVDYLQLMDPGESKASKVGRRDLEIGEISRGLKGLAKDLGIPIIALSQLNRMLEQRSDKRPMLSDLRESGALEQDADLVIFIYRDEVYNTEENNPNKGMADILLSKHRNGQTGIAKLAFLGAYTRFENLALERSYGQ